MKAKLKDGRVLPIEKGSLIALDNNGDTLEVNVEDIDSFIDDKIDWDKVRVDAAISAMNGFCANDQIGENDPNTIAVWSVEQADELIKELKK